MIQFFSMISNCYYSSNKTRAAILFDTRHRTNENNTRYRICGDRTRLSNCIIGARKRCKSQWKKDRSIIFKKKKKRKQFLESVITFDKLFKGMLNPRAIMPRSNLINFRSIDNRLRRFASRVVFSRLSFSE